MSDFYQPYIELENRKEEIERILDKITRSGMFVNGDQLVKVKDVAEALAKHELGFSK